VGHEEIGRGKGEGKRKEKGGGKRGEKRGEEEEKLFIILKIFPGAAPPDPPSPRWGGCAPPDPPTHSPSRRDSLLNPYYLKKKSLLKYPLKLWGGKVDFPPKPLLFRPCNGGIYLQ